MPSDSSYSSSSLDPSLLAPSLQRTAPTRPIFSTRAAFFTAFFGGVYASAMFSALNAARMRRLRSDAWICLLAALLWTVFLFWAARPGAPSWLDFAGEGGRGTRYIGNALGMLLFGLLYRRQRAFFQAQSLAGIDAANPWPASLASLGVAMVVSFAVALLAKLT